jgi:hypothetical protein
MSTMQRLTPQELRSRLSLDFRVCQHMFRTSNILAGEAYQHTSDLERGRNAIITPDRGHLARKYVVDFHVRTLIGRGRYADVTTIGFDLDVRNYPYEAPATWIISSPVPYSPHFKNRAPVCIGEIWERANGYMLLGQLLVHIAKLLNWDERMRSNYTGWNPDAIEHHRLVHRGRPITEGLQYPMLPPDLHNPNTPAAPASEPQVWFRPLQKPASPLDLPGDDLFKGKGIVK